MQFMRFHFLVNTDRHRSYRSQDFTPHFARDFACISELEKLSEFEVLACRLV